MGHVKRYRSYIPDQNATTNKWAASIAQLLKLVAPYCTIKNVDGSNADAKGQQPGMLGWLADDVPPNIYDKRIVVHTKSPNWDTQNYGFVGS